MNIIIRKVRVLAAPEPPFIGTRIRIKLDDPASLTWGVKNLTLAAGRDKAIIEWGDETRSELTASGELTHGYAAPGEYEVRISDDILSMAFSAKSSTSPFHVIYAPMIREFHTTALQLKDLAISCFIDASQLSLFSCEGSGLRTLAAHAFAFCPSLVGRVELHGITEVSEYSFANSSGITELHFSKVNESAIKSLPDWKSSGGKFGAPNAESFFDLP